MPNKQTALKLGLFLKVETIVSTFLFFLYCFLFKIHYPHHENKENDLLPDYSNHRLLIHETKHAAKNLGV